MLHRKISFLPVVLRSILLFSLICLGAETHLFAQAGVMPVTLIDPSSAAAAGQLSGGGQVAATPQGKGVNVTIKAGDNPYPGLTIKPANASSWNLAQFGHVEAKITNTGTKPINLNLRLDNAGDYTTNPYNSEAKSIDPGQTKIIRVYFGYSYNYQPSFKLNPGAVIQVLFFTGKTSDDLAFRIEDLKAGGWVGEKVGVDPDRQGVKPPGGVMVDPSTPVTAGQISVDGGAKGTVAADGKAVQIDFAGGSQESVTIRPAVGLWNLSDQVRVVVKVKNTGQTPITPSARVNSDPGPTDTVATAAPIAPGAEGEIDIPFQAKVPWEGINDPAQVDHKLRKSWPGQPGTGTNFISNRSSGVTILSDGTPGAKSLQVTSIVADLPPLTLPAWLGKKPPVDGDWVQTLNEDFDGNAIDYHRWSVHTANWWSPLMHFSKDQVLVNGGKLSLRLEKKPGYSNDDPTGKTKYSGVKTDYAAGQPETRGKWTQRYGYFEIREKQPTAKALWPGFWMMPDPNLKSSIPVHNGTELDVTESQSAWGPHRFNIAFHWDGYGDTAKGTGTSSNYVQADKDGYIVVGLLWLPGSYTVYGNGTKIFHWESPSVSDMQSYLILQNEIGGWDNDEADDSMFPADFVVDYIRVWQRKDLATPEDGAHPNEGGPDAPIP